MGSANGTAAPAPAATIEHTSADEPSDSDLSKIIFNSGAGGDEVDDAADAALDSPGADEDPDLNEDEDPDADPALEQEAAADGETPEGDAEDGEEEEAAADGQEEPEGEAPAEDESEDAETKAIRSKFTAEQQKLFDRAILKKTKRIMELRQADTEKAQRLQELEAAVTEMQAAAPVAAKPTADNPLADIESEAALEASLSEARATRRWARAHPQGGVLKHGEKEIEVSAEQAADMLAGAEEVIEEHAPARRTFLQARTQIERQAETAYPWLKQKTSQGYLAVENTLKRYPQLKAILPGARLAIADMLVGAQQRTAKPGAATKPSPTSGAAARDKLTPKAPATPAGGARPPKVSGLTKAHGAASKALVETGDDPDNAALRTILGTG